MYIYEKAFEFGKTLKSYEEIQEETRTAKRKPGQPVLTAPENVGESVSRVVYDNESLYAYNDTYIDVRTPNDEKRGIITLHLLVSFFIFVGAAVESTWWLIMGFLNEAQRWTLDYWFSVLFYPLTAFVAPYLYFKYIFRYIFLESLTARRLIVRFNRVTRKVYLLRPKRLGGIKILDWEKTGIIVEKRMTEMEGAGGFVVLAWDRGDGVDLKGQPTDSIELTFVGKKTRNASELLAFWEYIRRYMEDGPSAAPRPAKLICKFPWPWLSLKAAWGLDTSFFRNWELWIFVAINIVLSPLILIHATGHWISLLLCYEPRFPKAIEDAGTGLPADAMRSASSQDS